MAIIPIIKAALNAILPRELPSVIDECFINAALIPKINSGKEVPSAIKRIPKAKKLRSICSTIAFEDHTIENKLTTSKAMPINNLLKFLNAPNT